MDSISITGCISRVLKSATLLEGSEKGVGTKFETLDIVSVTIPNTPEFKTTFKEPKIFIKRRKAKRGSEESLTSF